MAQINYTERQTQQIDDLRQYVQDYCQSNGIDPSIYTQALDKTTGIDPDLLQSPVFQAYWQLAYLQLMEIVDPSLVQSLYSEVGEVNFDALYSRADPEMNTFIQNLVSDSPELMAFAAQADIDPATDPQALLDALTRNIPPPPPAVIPPSEAGNATEDPHQYVNEDARRLKEEFKLSGVWDWLIETDEGNRSTQNYLMEELAKLDQALADMEEGIRNHTISAEEADAGVAQYTQSKQFLLGAIQNLENAWSQLLEMMSKIIKQRSDMMQAIGQNLKA